MTWKNILPWTGNSAYQQEERTFSMNFDTSRKNYTGLAFVAVLHLVAAGIAVKQSTVWVTHADPGPVILVPPKALPPEPKPQANDDFDVAPAKPVITTPLPELDVNWDTERPTISTPPEGPLARIDPGPSGPGPGGKTEGPRAAPKTTAAVIDSSNCAKPSYPAAALRNGDEGTVTLAFLIGKDGNVASAKVERTSGHRDLDRAALQGLSLCAFKPGTLDGIAQESWARMQYAWRLDE
jgi:protein TonB